MEAWLNSVSDWLEFAIERSSELWLRTGEHLVLTGVSTGLAILFGIPLGILASVSSWLRVFVLGAIGIFQTIPSLAMLAILLAMIGKIGVVPAIIALTIYALLPIARNTVTGIDGVADAVVEASRGIGMTPLQQLVKVKLPLSLPVIIAGIRTSAVVGVGIATLSAFIGAGGLGQFINRGLALSNTQLILLGAIPAALLAVLVDGIVAAMAWGMSPLRQREKKSFKRVARPVALASPLILIGLTVVAMVGGRSNSMSPTGETIRVASKNFTEQLILGELMAQMIEAHTEIGVDRRFNLGGTMICHEALMAGEIDIYAEYTGTGLVTILRQPADSDADRVLEFVRNEYRKQFDLQWFEPLGFNNTYALTVRKADANQNNWKAISDLAGAADQLRAGFTGEFAERMDGYPGVRNKYKLNFASVVDLEPALMYQAVANNEVDVICAFTTDGRIAALDLYPLVDDRHFFPPYFAAPVIRLETLKRFPELEPVLARLAGVLDDGAMQELNYKVDEQNRSPRDVASEFLISNGLIEERND